MTNAAEHSHPAAPPVVRRSVKPENVRIGEGQTERVMFSDLGVSRIPNDPKLVECTPGGTPFYFLCIYPPGPNPPPAGVF